MTPYFFRSEAISANWASGAWRSSRCSNGERLVLGENGTAGEIKLHFSLGICGLYRYIRVFEFHQKMAVKARKGIAKRRGILFFCRAHQRVVGAAFLVF